MVEQVDNPVNKNMSYSQSRTPAGILNVPQSLPKKVIYSGTEAQKQYNEMQRDLYIGEKNAKEKEKHKFPKVLKILLGITGITSLILFRKNIGKMLKKLFKNPYKKKTVN